ncbi:helix-hairpin-helix domain-containing protein [Subtercola boreus]|uniref:helix-hairpin-helix domain-containing protein n=1 Tax=Subtercola boreus TaxID=120213 RepID=UPI0011699C4E|nr:helix-hairpin-helix domain-containing protein [Subtercola boreus]TQL54121.1 competence protein ComEA [Subtercola boreus]
MPAARAAATVPLPWEIEVPGRDSELEPELEPPAARSRLRLGVGAAVVLVIVALVCAVLVSMFAGHGRAEVVALPSGAGGPSGSTVSGAHGATLAPASAEASAPVGHSSETLILVHVLGAVVHPGLFELHSGDRVIDAISAAGGFSEKADQGRQNLARVMADGEQLVIPEQGASLPPGSPGSGAGGSGSGAGGVGGAGAVGGVGGPPPPLVNLNTADQATLETLPHVGPAMAQRIIAWRTENGRFTQVDDLKNVSGVGDKTFEALAPLVTT